MTDDETRPDSRARHVATLKSAFMTIVDAERLRQVTEKLVSMALEGNTTAAKLLLDRAFDRHMVDGPTQKKGSSLEERHAAAVEKFARSHGSD